MRVIAALTLAVLAAPACGPGDAQPRQGHASGSFDCEIFVPGSNPPNYGQGIVEISFPGDERVLAQGAAAFAIDSEGRQTLDPSEAAYFAVQVYQNVSETTLEVFEARVLPANWTPGEHPFDGTTVLGLLAEIEHDANGTVTEIRLLAESRTGTLTLTTTGQTPGTPVTGHFTDLELQTP